VITRKTRLWRFSRPPRAILADAAHSHPVLSALVSGGRRAGRCLSMLGVASALSGRWSATLLMVRGVAGDVVTGDRDGQCGVVPFPVVVDSQVEGVGRRDTYWPPTRLPGARGGGSVLSSARLSTVRHPKTTRPERTSMGTRWEQTAASPRTRPRTPLPLLCVPLADAPFEPVLEDRTLLKMADKWRTSE